MVPLAFGASGGSLACQLPYGVTLVLELPRVETGQAFEIVTIITTFPRRPALANAARNAEKTDS